VAEMATEKLGIIRCAAKTCGILKQKNLHLLVGFSWSELVPPLWKCVGDLYQPLMPTCCSYRNTNFLPHHQSHQSNLL